MVDGTGTPTMAENALELYIGGKSRRSRTLHSSDTGGSGKPASLPCTSR
ncbi:MAG: hypothetical protein RLZZ450_4230 [Pseudomonadota bacterium]|jgi:hypothetical protein